MMSRHLMIIPSTACPASCHYCFGPHRNSESMRRETLEAVASWQIARADDEPLELTFHGGEPLVPGVEFYRMALPLLRQGLAPRRVRLSVQSNLWLLTDELCELFREYDVSLGTSLDGPESINDAQRGKGYYRRTMRGVELAHEYGLDVGFICTITSQSVQRMDEIFEFFLRHGISFNLHASLPGLSVSRNDDCHRQEPGWQLSPEDHGRMLTHMLDRYLGNVDKIRSGTLDSMCRSVSVGNGGVCTFGDCLGKYLSVAPNGDIYSCQRFIGLTEYRLGNVHDDPSLLALADTTVWRMFQDRQERVSVACSQCPHLSYCRGGCPYNALVANHGSFDGALRDPHCPAYKQAFDSIVGRALADVFSESNMQAVVNKVDSKYGLLREGRLLQVMRGGPHPQEVAAQARKVVAAVALAASESPDQAVAMLNHAGLVTDPDCAVQSVTALQAQLGTQSQGLVNAYLHVTYGCNLSCDHCYASSSPRTTNQVMPVENVGLLVKESSEAGFGKVVITGGEPLAHPDRVALLDALAGLRLQIKPVQIVLRTNLAYPLSPRLAEQLVCSFDQIVVSVDGNRTSHDERRGANAYEHTVANLRKLIAVYKDNVNVRKDWLVIAATLATGQIDGPEGDAVRALADDLGIGHRFKPVLPLGRAVGMTVAPEYYTSLDDDDSEAITRRVVPRSTCGLGMNLYIAPDGQCYPCYALTGANHNLGNALTDGLNMVLERNVAYRRMTVDSNNQCKHCALRYLCGGFCRAWGSSNDPDAPPNDCATLHEQGRGLLLSSLRELGVSIEQWQSAGLPLPTMAPAG